MTARRLSVVARAAVLTTVVAAVGTACADSSVSGDASSPARGEVDGTVLTAPTCPVLRSASPCPPRPVAAAEVTVFSGRAKIATTRSDPQGQFVIMLVPGPYRIQARLPNGLRSTSSTTVAVTTTSPVRVTLTLESGIR